MILYVVEGQYDTDFEGIVFAVCTTKESAERALKMTLDGEDVQITEVIADTIKIDDEVISTKEGSTDESRKAGLDDIKHQSEGESIKGGIK